MTPNEADRYLQQVAVESATRRPYLGPYRAKQPFTIPASSNNPELMVVKGEVFSFDGDEPVDIHLLVRTGMIEVHK